MSNFEPSLHYSIFENHCCPVKDKNKKKTGAEAPA